MTQQPKDYMGRVIECGHVLVYPVRRGSQMWMNKCRVTGIEARPSGCVVIGYDPDGVARRRLQIKNLTNCVVVEG